MKRKIKVNVPQIPIGKIKFRRFSEKEKMAETLGQAPGTLIYTGSRKEDVKFQIYSYNEKEIEISDGENWTELKDKIVKGRVNWINVVGLHQVSKINELGDDLGLHPLLLEDVLHVDQRPKTEDFGDYIFFTIKMFHKNKEQDDLEFEHLSFVLGKGTVICFQEFPGDVFDLLRERLSNSFGKIRQKGADYLFYRFIDIIIDHYFLVLDHIAEKIEGLEDEVMDKPTTNTLQKLQMVRKEMIYLRRSIFPLRESINGLLKSENALLSKETERFLSDLYDHIIQVNESLETYRDLLSGIMDLYMNTASNKMNEIMKVLTIMSTIFIPMTFIAGIYGMNFQHMPELQYEWAYPGAWVLMILIAIIMLIYFKKKDWI